MSFDAIQFGSVIRFSYLWTREAVSGETEGRKDRPTAFGMKVPKPNGEDLVVLLSDHEAAAAAGALRRRNS